jgi:hypothetical protein
VEALEALIQRHVHPHAVVSVVPVACLPRAAEVEIQIDALVNGSGSCVALDAWQPVALPAKAGKWAQCSRAHDGRAAYAALHHVDVSTPHLQEAIGRVRAVIESAVRSVASLCAASPVAVVRVYCPVGCYSNASQLASQLVLEKCAPGKTWPVTVVASALPSSHEWGGLSVVQVNVW